GSVLASLRYAPPEQFAGGPAAADPRGDLYSLGLVLYEMATGGHPFSAPTAPEILRRVLSEKPRRAGDVNSQLSPFLEELLAALLEKEPARRLHDAASLREVLDAGE